MSKTDDAAGMAIPLSRLEICVVPGGETCGAWLEDLILDASAICEDRGARVAISSQQVLKSKLTRFRDELNALYETLQGRARFEFLERSLRVDIEAIDSVGHMSVRVAITPDDVTQHHEFRFNVDQTDVRPTIEGLNRALAKIERGEGTSV